ncbi:inorganic phosphate transporter family protein [bacterium]|nr:inorganic phosphate transporter family protein [bacterium]
MEIVLLLLAGLFVAYANGANDNFKGVATLYGGRVLPYGRALQWATITTIAGSLISFFAAGKLLKLFTGNGLVNSTATADPHFVMSVALGAAFTVILATLFSLPISTTHSLVGGLTGAGLASGSLLSFSVLGKSFFLPLIAGPVIAVGMTAFLYSIFHGIRLRVGIESSTCLCVGQRQEVVIGIPGNLVVRSTGIKLTVDQEQYCRKIYAGSVGSFSSQKVVDSLHILSAGAVSFARGLNDTPKIAALLLMLSWFSPRMNLFLIAGIMAIGGLIHSAKIAKRMSFGITDMNPGQGFTGNLVTAILVITGSLYGLPLSTTHVSVGSLFGIGIVSRTARIRSILQILSAWLFTLPVSALLAAVCWYLLR